MKKIILITGLLVLLGMHGYAQRKSLRDSSYSLPIIGLHISGEMPAADLAHRFGNSMSVGMPFLYKTSSNWVFGLEGNYFFGTKIKEQPMRNLVNIDGTITDVNGNPATFRLNERGWSTYAVCGRVFNKLGHNKNSGLMTWIGLGYLTHKISIYDVGHTLPQVHGDLVKGYDKLTGGIATSQFIGYLFMSQNRIANFYAGFEFQEAFTKGLRGFQYDTMASDGQSRLDILCGVRFGWLLPLYKKAPKDFYYY
jgi:hypothetical protein